MEQAVELSSIMKVKLFVAASLNSKNNHSKVKQSKAKNYVFQGLNPNYFHTSLTTVCNVILSQES